MIQDNTVQVTQRLQAPPAAVWSALTDIAEIKQWYFDWEAFKAEPGFTFRFSGGPSPERQYVHICEVTEVLPQRMLAYSWRYEGFPGNSLVSFLLQAEGGDTLLTLTHTGIDSFPADNPDFDIRNFDKGWQSIIQSSLVAYMEKKS